MPRLYSANFSLLFHYCSLLDPALLCLRKSDPFRHTAQLYSANAHQFISKAKLVKSQPVQNISAHCLCRSQLFDTETPRFSAIAYPVLTMPSQFSSQQRLCISCPRISLALRYTSVHCPCVSVLNHYASCHNLFGSEHVPFVSALNLNDSVRCHIRSWLYLNNSMQFIAETVRHRTKPLLR